MAPAELKELKVRLQELIDKGFTTEYFSLGDSNFVCEEDGYHQLEIHAKD